MSTSVLSTAVAVLCAVALAMALSSSTILAQDAPSDFLSSHNSARRQVRVPALQWDSTLANYASGRAALCQFSHASGPYGENLFWGWGTPFHAADAVASWVSERQYYDCSSNSCAAGRTCGHYTQVVWQQTARIGCARVVCPASSLPGAGGPVYYFVCNYDPAGNFRGQRPYPCTQSSGETPLDYVK